MPVVSAHLSRHEAAACGNKCLPAWLSPCAHLILANRERSSRVFSLMLIKMSRQAFTPHRTGFCGNSISPEGPGCVNVWYTNNIVFTTGTFTWGLNWEKCHANPQMKESRFLCFSRKYEWVSFVQDHDTKKWIEVKAHWNRHFSFCGLQFTFLPNLVKASPCFSFSNNFGWSHIDLFFICLLIYLFLFTIEWKSRYTYTQMKMTFCKPKKKKDPHCQVNLSSVKT